MKNIKLVSWNVNGIRSCLSKGLKETVQELNPDILCLQEIKADALIMNSLVEKEFPNFKLFNSSALKKGYSGVATLIKNELSELVRDHSTSIVSKQSKSSCSTSFSDEGRYSILRTPKFTLYNIYIPSGTSGESRQALKYIFLDELLEVLKQDVAENTPIILTGDFNICHKPIDIHHPRQAEKLRLTGFLPEERAWMDKLVKTGFVDCFRAYAGDKEQVYSWWSYRANSRPKNLGWRIDYFFCSNGLVPNLEKAQIHSDIKGSDHCPVSVIFRV